MRKTLIVLVVLLAIPCFANRFENVGKEKVYTITETQFNDLKSLSILLRNAANWKSADIDKPRGFRTNCLNERLDLLDKVLEKINPESELTFEEQISLLKGEISLLKMEISALKIQKKDR